MRRVANLISSLRRRKLHRSHHFPLEWRIHACDEERDVTVSFSEDAFAAAAASAAALLTPAGGCSSNSSNSINSSDNNCSSSNCNRRDSSISSGSKASRSSWCPLDVLAVQARRPGQLRRARRVSHRLPLLCFQVSKRERAPPVAHLGDKTDEEDDDASDDDAKETTKKATSTTSALRWQLLRNRAAELKKKKKKSRQHKSPVD